MGKKWSVRATKSTAPEVIKNASEACFSGAAATTTGDVSVSSATADSSDSPPFDASTADSSRNATDGVVR